MTQGRYTAAARRQVEANRAAALEAQHRAEAAMTLEDFLAARLEAFGPAASFVLEANVASWTARHAELVNLYS